MASMFHTQLAVCRKFNTKYVASPLYLKVGIALNVLDNLLPINGLRHPPEGDSTGWYIWAGEIFDQSPDFFQPLCVKHLPDWCPMVIPYLGLPPAYRFLIAPDYEDVWEDSSLLDID